MSMTRITSGSLSEATRGWEEALIRAPIDNNLESMYVNILIEGAKLRLNFQENNLTTVELDKAMQGYARLWADSLIPRMLPRPLYPNHLVSFENYFKYYLEWIDSWPALMTVPKTDSITVVGWGSCLTAIVHQVLDTLKASIFSYLEVFYLNSNTEELFNRITRTLALVGAKVSKQHGCMRILHQFSSMCAQLSGTPVSCGEKVVSFLLEEGFIECASAKNKNRIFKSVDLKDNAEMEIIFNEAECDRSELFGDHFIIELSHYKDSNKTIVTVFSRNNWCKDRFVARLAENTGLQIDNGCVSPNTITNCWIEESVKCFDLAALSYFWTLQVLASEGTINSSNRSAFLNCLNFVCSFCVEHLICSEWRPSPLKNYLWESCINASVTWLWEITKFPLKDRFLLLRNVLHILNQIAENYDIIIEGKNKEICLLLNSFHSLSQYSDSNPSYHHKYLKATLQRYQGGHPEETEGLFNLQLVGRGAFGDVYKCFDARLGNVIALKEMELYKAASTDNDATFHEVDILRFLQHRHIIKCYGFERSSKYLFLKTELCEGGTLRNMIEKDGALNDLQFRGVALQIIMGLSYLHGNHIVHGDLKPENILRDHYGTLKLADFGASRGTHLSKFKKILELSIGTVAFMAPETVTCGECTLESDMWSFGCTLYYMATGMIPWNEYGDQWNMIMAIGMNKPLLFDALHRSNLNPDGIELIKSCLKANPLLRATSKSVLLSNYLFEPEKIDGFLYL